MITVWNPAKTDWKDDDIPEKLELKTKFEVCPQCEGRGKSSAYLGAYTQSEFDEAGPEFREDYMRGEYDRTCETCKGERVVEVVDRKNNSAELLALYDKEEEERWIDRQTHRMEMGMYGDM